MQYDMKLGVLLTKVCRSLPQFVATVPAFNQLALWLDLNPQIHLIAFPFCLQTTSFNTTLSHTGTQ